MLGLVWESLIHSNDDVREVRAPLAAPSHAGAQRLLDYWWEHQPRGGIVVGKHLPSHTLRTELKSLAIYEPVDGGREFRVRLAGTAYLRRFARETGGLRLSEFLARENLMEHRWLLANAIGMAAPLVHDVRVVVGKKTYIEFETLHLKVWAPDMRAAWALEGLFFRDWS